jgi:hypothetical protein
MKSTSPHSNSPVPVNFYSEECAFILDEYCYRQMASIPLSLRRLLINKIHITARSFILLFQRNYLYNPDRMKISPQDLEKLSNLYETLRVTGGPAERSSRGKKDFNLRCRVISDLIPMPAEALEKFMCGSRRRFHLFGCLNDVIFEHLKLSDNKREILNHQFGFSDRYEQIRKAELAKRQNISRSSVSSAAAVISRKTDDAIKRFKFLEPYYSYKKKYKLDRGVTEVTAKMCERIRKEEGAEGITPYFAARVFALIYNLKLRAVPYGEEVVYFLVPREAEGRNIMQTPESEVDKKSFERLFEKMGKDIEAMENLWDSEDYMKVLDCMMRRGKKKSQG